MTPRTPEQFASIREKRMQHILEAALQEFVISGYHKASMAAIARTAGISKGLIYNYFSGKQEVLEVLLDRFLNEMESMMSVRNEDGLDSDQLRDLISRIINNTSADIRKWKLYFALSLQPHVMPVFKEKIMTFFSPYMEQVSRHYAARGYDHPEQITRYFFAVMDGVLFHIILDPEGFPKEWVRDKLIEDFT